MLSPVTIQDLEQRGFRDILAAIRSQKCSIPQEIQEKPNLCQFYAIPNCPTQWKAIYEEKNLIISMEQSQLQKSEYPQLEAQIIYEEMLRQNLRTHIHNLSTSISTLNTKISEEEGKKTRIREAIDAIEDSALMDSRITGKTQGCLGLLE